MQLSVILRHVTAAVQCSSTQRNGKRCAATTNHLCAECGDALCGRHQFSHLHPRGSFSR